MTDPTAPSIARESTSSAGSRRLTMSVVVASNRAPSLLRSCLASLRPQCERVGAELIVARAGPLADIAAVEEAMPAVRFLSAPSTASIPELRGLGMTSAHGEIVAVTEDHCIVGEHWVDVLVSEAHASADVIGGGMDNAQRRRALDWAAFFSEYGFFAATRPDSLNGDTPLLTGANVAYRRPVVAEVAEWARQGEWENVAHTRLSARGTRMRFVPSALVFQNNTYGFTPFCVDRYEHGRDFARKRLAEDSQARRWVLLCACPVLPALLTWRVAKATIRGRVTIFLRALPATFAFLTAWSIGEAVGYLQGPSTSATSP